VPQAQAGAVATLLPTIQGLPQVVQPTSTLPSVPSLRPAPLPVAPLPVKPVPAAQPAAPAPQASAPAPAATPAPPAPAAFEAGEDPLSDLASRCEALDRSDYFEVMRLPREATPVQIKKAFHHWSRTLHPDRFYQLENAQMKAQVSELYKRITEAYFVLRDEEKRRKYLEDISGPDRAARLRYTEQTEAEMKAQAKKQAEEQLGSNPKARQFYAEALKDEAAGRLKEAERNVKSALMYDAQNATFKAKLAELQAAIESTRDKSEALKIK
jgi:hypothetical protein